MIWAIVPAKALELAKTRLAGLLDLAERRALVLAMLRDVLGALRGVRALDGVMVVTRDEAVSAVASASGAEVLRETNVGQNEALEEALARCRWWGAAAVLLVSSDLPLLRPATVEQVITQGMRGNLAGSVVLAPSRDGTGTNAMFQRPPGVLPLRFGASSLQQHQQAASECGVRVDLVRTPDLALDIDTPADLLEFVRCGGQSHTRGALGSMHLLERIPAYLTL